MQPQQLLVVGKSVISLSLSTIRYVGRRGEERRRVNGLTFAQETFDDTWYRFGALADRRGYRDVMQIGLFLNALGYFIVGSSINVWMAAIGMMLGGLGHFVFGPTLQAYLSARLPYAQRARGLGILEYSWALA